MYRENMHVDDLGLVLRELFIKHKSQQLGKKYRPSPKLDKRENWVKAAVKCESLCANPQDFVECMFKYSVGKDHGGPYISHLYSKSMNYAYEKFEKDGNVEEKQLDDFLEDIHSARDQIVCAVKYRNITAEQFLLNDIMPIRPIVKLFLQQNSQRIWNKYADPAKVEVLNDPALERKLNKLKFNTKKLYEFCRYD